MIEFRCLTVIVNDKASRFCILFIISCENRAFFQSKSIVIKFISHYYVTMTSKFCLNDVMLTWIVRWNSPSHFHVPVVPIAVSSSLRCLTRIHHRIFCPYKRCPLRHHPVPCFNLVKIRSIRSEGPRRTVVGGHPTFGLLKLSLKKLVSRITGSASSSGSTFSGMTS